MKYFPSHLCQNANRLFYNGSRDIHHYTEMLLGNMLSRCRVQNLNLFSPALAFSNFCRPVLQPTTVNTPLITNVRHKKVSDRWLLYYLHTLKPKKKRAVPRPLDGRPQMKGIVLRTLIKKPKKPNSANRKCVLVRLSNGKEAVAHVPGIGHNLQEHNAVLVRCGRTKDVPGLKLKVIRGVYDCAPVIKRSGTS